MIDLRSDTVTRPSPAMREAMARADVGDDVYGEDPTVNALETRAAALLGFDAALFVASGTQANLCALLSHCQRGDEYIAGHSAHTYRFEGGGAAALGAIQPQPIPFEPDGTLDLDAVGAAVKPDDYHFARTRLLCLENTQSGKPLPMDYFPRARAFCDARGLSLHLDGARLFNAAVACGVEAVDIARHVDSVAFCLSKGLGAPAGSLLAGDADFVRSARRWRKVLGGGMRQAGILAAAGLFALEHHVERLGEDHERAAHLAEGLRGIADGAYAAGIVCHTNMVFVGPDLATREAALLERGVCIEGERWVLHLDIDDADVEHVLDAVSSLPVRR